jgi:DNA-binding transcriptional LysR family regulator
MKGANGWDALEVRHLRAFMAVAHHGSFGGAADELGYTQSAVSQQLRALERIVGSPLLHRYPGGRRPVELTETGRLLLEHSRDLLARVGATQADLAALARGEQGRVTVATIQSIGARILPRVLAAHRAARPNVEVEINEMRAAEDLVDAVESGAADVGFSVLPVRSGPFEVRELRPDPYVLVTAADSDARGLDDLERQRLIGIRGCAHDRLVEERLLAAGIVPASVDRFDDNGMIQELVATGEGIAVVPELTIDPGDERIAVHPLASLPARRLAAVLHRERWLAPAAAELVETACQLEGGGGGRKSTPCSPASATTASGV